MINSHRRTLHGRSRKVKEGHGRSFPITVLTFQARKVRVGGGVVVSCRIILSNPVPQSLSSGLWTLDLGLGFGTLDLDLGLTIFEWCYADYDMYEHTSFTRHCCAFF